MSGFHPTKDEVSGEILDVNIVSGGSGGTQYTEGDTDASITGNAFLWEDTSDTLRAISMAKPLPVQPGTSAAFPVTDNGGSLTVDGTITETNSSSALTSLQLIDDVVFAEDAASSNGDKGIQVLAVRKGTPANTSGTDGDYEPLQVSAGRLWASATIDAALPAGTNTLGSVKLTDGTDVADILDLTNSNPLTVAIVDGSGDQITSFGGGTQYTEDAAAAANPVGTVPILVRKDTPASEVSADGDNIAHRGSAYGAAYVTLLDTGGNAVSVGGGTQYTEDAAAASDPIGNALIMVRKDTLAALTSADGDNVAARGTDKGELYVKHVDNLTVNSHAVTNAGTFVVQENGSALTALQKIDDPVLVDDAAFTPASSSVIMAGAEFDDSSPDSVDEGDAGALRMSANRNLYVRIRDNAGNERGLNIDANGEFQISGTRNALPITDNSGSITVDNGGTFAVQATVAAGATNIAKAEDVASADADVGVPVMAVRKATPANTSGTDGDYEMMQISAGRLWTSATIDAALPAGTNAIGKLAANSGVDIGDVDITSVVPGTGATNLGKAEDAAHSSGDTGVMMLGVRETTLTDLSAGNTDGDYEPVQVNKAGAMWVTGAPSGTSGWSVATGSIGATKTDIGTANTAGNVGGWYIYNANSSVAYVQFFNTQASGVTLGTTAPVYSLGIPATSAANIAPGMVGISHSTAICIAITTTRAGSTGPSSTVDYNIWYKQ